jgi:hypothetical protein
MIYHSMESLVFITLCYYIGYRNGDFFCQRLKLFPRDVDKKNASKEQQYDSMNICLNNPYSMLRSKMLGRQERRVDID